MTVTETATDPKHGTEPAARSSHLARFRARREWKLFAALHRADLPLTAVWWTILLARALLPVVFAIAMGVLVGSVQHDRSIVMPLIAVGFAFLGLQVLAPIHQVISNNLGDRTAIWLYDQLTDACVGPPGVGHLEDPELASDLTVARDFDLGMTAPPLSISMDFIAGGLVELIAGLAAAALLVAYAWWAPLLLAGAWLCTHWFLRESGVWRDRNTDEVRSAQREADYAYRLAVDPPAAKELRLFGLRDWVLDRFVTRRTRLHRLQYEATKLRERSMLATVLIVVVANLVVFAAIARDLVGDRIELGAAVVFAQAAIGASAIAFGGLNWSLDGAATPVEATLRLGESTARIGGLPRGSHPAAAMPAHEIRFRDVTFGYPTGHGPPVLRHLDLTVPAGTSLAIVGRNGAGKTTLAKLICRLYDPRSGSVEVDGTDLRELDLAEWRSRIAAVFQDFLRLEMPVRDNVAPSGAPDEVILESLATAGLAGIGSLDTILSKGYAGGVDLSGGQWQRIALARALCSVRLGAGVVLLDEPTAQLDARGEAEIFERILAETRHCTTILISHRFSTVRHADRICVLEGGAVVELGSHDELIAAGGRYRTMFELQAVRFTDEYEEGVAYDVLD